MWSVLLPILKPREHVVHTLGLYGISETSLKVWEWFEGIEIIKSEIKGISWFSIQSPSQFHYVSEHSRDWWHWRHLQSVMIGTDIARPLWLSDLVMWSLQCKSPILEGREQEMRRICHSWRECSWDYPSSTIPMLIRWDSRSCKITCRCVDAVITCVGGPLLFRPNAACFRQTNPFLKMLRIWGRHTVVLVIAYCVDNQMTTSIKICLITMV